MPAPETANSARTSPQIVRTVIQKSARRRGFPATVHSGFGFLSDLGFCISDFGLGREKGRAVGVVFVLQPQRYLVLLAHRFQPLRIMKTKLPALLVTLLGLSLLPASAQPGGPGGPPKGPNFGGSMGKLLGEATSFSANLDMTAKDPSGGELTIPGKIAFHDGKSRFEMDLSLAKGGSLPPAMAAQMKAMGMDKMEVIARPDKKLSYTVYVGLKAYVETAIPDNETPAATSKYKVESTELGKETLDGHPCVKNKVVVTDDQGEKHTSTVWNASDLKKFPLKIEAVENGQPVTMIFKDVKLAKPDEALFAAPTGYTRYDNPMSLMMQEMMKRRGAGGFAPPGH
jgi:hypothetical protein